MLDWGRNLQAQIGASYNLKSTVAPTPGGVGGATNDAPAISSAQVNGANWTSARSNARCAGNPRPPRPHSGLTSLGFRRQNGPFVNCRLESFDIRGVAFRSSLWIMAQGGTNVQEAFYGEVLDYRVGSPHLAHWSLYDRLVSLLRREITDLATRGLPMKVLEVGAGHGGYTEPALAAGCRLTATDMSRSSVERLRFLYGTNEAFQAIHDPDGSLAPVNDRFALILFVSVIHHVPDYLGLLDRASRLLLPGGALLTLQDPIWYSRVGRLVHVLDRVGYLTWRLGRGKYRQGLATAARRIRGRYDESKPSDMVEYHVVRHGVDEESIARLLENRFERVTVIRYWSNQLSAMQWLGDRLKVVNTFALNARGYRPGP